jgi:hypothetical protein
MEPTMTTIEAAGFLGVQPQTLRYWRMKGRGPAYERDGRAISYAVSELVAWRPLIGKRVPATSDTAETAVESADHP